MITSLLLHVSWLVSYCPWMRMQFQLRVTRFGVKSALDWPQMGQIRDFFRSDFSTFWRGAPKCTEIWSEKVPDFSHFGPELKSKMYWKVIWKGLRFKPFGSKSDLIWNNSDIIAKTCYIWSQPKPNLRLNLKSMQLRLKLLK